MRAFGMNVNICNTNDEYVARMKELGFSAAHTASLTAPAEQARIADLFARHGLFYEFLHSPFSHMNDIWLDCEGGEVMLAELMESVDRCAECGIPVDVIHLSSGIKAPSVSDLGRRRYHTLVEHAARRNVKLAFENLRKLYNVAWAMEEFRDCPHVGFCWDSGHEVCYTPTIEFMTLYGDRLLCTHIHDNRGIPCQDDHMIPFDGVANFERLAHHIRTSGYEGPITMELSNAKHAPYRDLSPFEFMERAASAARRIVAMIEEDA